MVRLVKLKINWNKKNGQGTVCLPKKKLPLISKDAKYLITKIEGWE